MPFLRRIVELGAWAAAYPGLVNVKKKRTGSHGPVEIVDLPSYKMVDLSSSFFVNVYQRVKSRGINKPPSLWVSMLKWSNWDGHF